jgi:hypothetical protein
MTVTQATDCCVATRHYLEEDFMSVGSSDTTIEVSRLMGPKPGRHKGNGTRKACILTPAPGGFLGYLRVIYHPWQTLPTAKGKPCDPTFNIKKKVDEAFR